jgi:hypothetical protein
MSESRRDAADLLIEAATAAFRERDPETRALRPAPEFLDLPPAERDALFAHQMRSRLLERALDARGLSTTAHAVLGRLPFLGQFPAA